MHKIWKECSINQELQNDKSEGSRLDLTDVQRAKITFCCVYVLAGVQPATDCVVVVVVVVLLTCSVHHDYFGVFLPQEGTEIGAPLAELPLPQSWSRTNSKRWKELKSGHHESSINGSCVRIPGYELRAEAAGGPRGCGRSPGVDASRPPALLRSLRLSPGRG